MGTYDDFSRDAWLQTAARGNLAETLRDVTTRPSFPSGSPTRSSWRFCLCAQFEALPEKAPPRGVLSGEFDVLTRTPSLRQGQRLALMVL